MFNKDDTVYLLLKFQESIKLLFILANKNLI